MKVVRLNESDIQRIVKRVLTEQEVISKDDFINQTQNLEIQNHKLKAARDILLPRLMNRTIEV